MNMIDQKPQEMDCFLALMGKYNIYIMYMAFKTICNAYTTIYNSMWSVIITERYTS